MDVSTDTLFRLLADPVRRSLIERMRNDGEVPVHALADRVPVSQPAVSRHLAQLRAAGLVRARVAGRETFYSISPGTLKPLADWVGTFDATEPPLT